MDYKLYQYNYNDFRLVCYCGGYHEVSDIDGVTTSVNNSVNASLSRARRMVREYILCNSFEWFVTITINQDNANRYNIDDCFKNLRRRLKTFKQYNPEFSYIFVAEQHPSSGAFHFHGVLHALPRNDIVEYHEKDFEKLPYYILNKLRRRRKTLLF